MNAVPVKADFQAGLAAYNAGDYATALKEWQPIAERGDANAEYNLGLLFARGQGVAQDYQKAAEWYQKAAEQGVAAAQYNLGVMYANGQGVGQNAREAANWFQKAAEQGITGAESSLAELYSEKEGPFQNFTEAEKWYRKAAEKGVASAAFDLGVMYDVGQGVQQDYMQAIEWYTKAANAGYAPALTNLGILAYNAQGMKRDLVQAYAWFALAQKQGDPRAGELLRTTAERMKPKEIKLAETRMNEWHPTGHPHAPEQEAGLFKEPETTPAGTAPASEKSDLEKDAAKTAPATPAVTAASAGAPPEQAKPGTPLQPINDVSASSRPPDVWTGVERIVAIGDVHGDYEQFIKVLQSAELIDASGNWIGGKAHLVQTGDIVDRGPDSRAIMDLLIRLEQQANAAGGAVHTLIGNHEAMDVYGDLRYVSAAEFSAFRPLNLKTDQQFAYDAQSNTVNTIVAEPARSASQAIPGVAEWTAAFGAEGVYGRWIRSHNAVVKIDRTLFVHAGLGQKYADWSLDRINDTVRQELRDFNQLHGGIATDEQGPLWFRGLAEGDESTYQPLVDQLLKHFDVDRIVIGHSDSNAAITPRFHGKVILIDVGLSRVYDNTGKIACLEIDNEHAYALHRGQGIDLPKDENGPDMLRYLRQAASLDPKPSPLEPRIRELEQTVHQ